MPFLTKKARRIMKRILHLFTGIVVASLALLIGAAAPAAAQEYAPSQAVFVDTDGLNFRSDPGLDGEVVDLLPFGTEGTVVDGPVEEDGYSWYELDLDNGGSGWVAGGFLSPVSGAGAFGLGDGVRVTAGVLHVRDEPSLSGTVTTSVTEGTTFTVADGPTEADGYTWYQVHSLGVALPLEGNLGWVAGEFLVYDPAVTGCEGQGPCPTGLEPGDGIRVAADALNLRADAELSSDVMAVLPQGTQGVVTDGPTNGEDYVWIEVDTDSYGEGWIARDFVVADPSAGGAPEFSAGTEVEVVDGELNLRSDSTLAADVVAVMADGTPLTVTDGPVLSDGYTWYEVTSDEYGIGWAAGEFLNRR
jgi:uncharacterized protein YgiM (DUF1202 family)